MECHNRNEGDWTIRIDGFDPTSEAADWLLIKRMRGAFNRGPYVTYVPILASDSSYFIDDLLCSVSPRCNTFVLPGCDEVHILGVPSNLLTNIELISVSSLLDVPSHVDPSVCLKHYELVLRRLLTHALQRISELEDGTHQIEFLKVSEVIDLVVKTKMGLQRIRGETKLGQDAESRWAAFREPAALQAF